MKLTKENIGQKFKVLGAGLGGWEDEDYFLLLSVTSIGNLVGEDIKGRGVTFNKESDFFIPYKEPKEKEKVLMSHAICKNRIDKDMPCLSFGLFESLDEAKKNKGDLLLSWPARIVIKNAKIDNFNQTITGDLFFEVEK